MKRYEFVVDCAFNEDLVESESGPVVKYEDHAADRAELVAQLEAAERNGDAHHADAQRYYKRADAAEYEVTRLTEALADEQKRHRKTYELRVAAEKRLNPLTEALAAAERGRADFINATMTEAHRAAEARVRELTEALATAERKAASWERGHDYAWELKVAAESRVRELEERVARASASAIVADTQLAAANALLERCQKAVSPVSLLGRDLDAHIAAQSSTAPKCAAHDVQRDPGIGPRPPCICNQPATTRARDELAELRVLDAMRTADIVEYRCGANKLLKFKLELHADLVCRAELARREALRG